MCCLQACRVADELEWDRWLQRELELRKQFFRQPDAALVTSLVRREHRDRSHCERLASGCYRVRLDRAEPVRVEPPGFRVPVEEVVAGEEPVDVELQRLFVWVKPERDRGVNA
jgi:hypothetical protein